MKIKPLSIAILSTSALALTQLAVAQDSDIVEEEVTVTGIRASLQNALIEKRESNNLVEVIQAVDVGKLPDQNLAEVLENVTGVQITRTAGVGTGVQIRGTGANRVEFNGVSTVGSGAGRSGINFEDVNASIISAVEVTKSPDAKTIEGSVGGTVNLKTIRPLELKETLGSLRVQGEQNNLSSEGGWSPRLSGAFGNNWETDLGDMGFVISGSFTKQEAVSFRPRADADNLFSKSSLKADALAVQGIDAADIAAAPDEYLGVQFLLQEQENDDYETINLATTFEWAPNDNMKFYVDYVTNDQERSRDQYRLQASGVSSAIDTNLPTEFETVDFGQGLFPNGPEDLDLLNPDNLAPGVVPSDLTSEPYPQLQRAVAGNIIPFLDDDDDDPNLRFTTETGSRITKSDIFVIGGEWEGERLSALFEVASTSSHTRNPTLNTTLNFINPNCPLDGSSNDNCVPFVYDLTGNSLAFDVITDQSITPFAPSDADFLNPENVVLDAVSQGLNSRKNTEDAIRLDFSYAIAESGITSVDFGYRRNESETRFRNVGDSFGFSAMEDSPNGLLFEELLITGPSNFGEADGRSLFIDDFLLIDPDRSFEDPEGVLEILEDALAEHRLLNPSADGALTIEPEFNEIASYNVQEDTDALYAQVNFEAGIFRGNFGLRHVSTSLKQTSAGAVDLATGEILQETTGASYDFLLPRLNLVAQVSEDVVLRFGYGSDIRRPEFDDVVTALDFDESENELVQFGNPALEPEEVDSLDIAAEWYFSPESVVSLGYFRKERSNVFGTFLDGALLSPGATDSGLERETDITCPGGGVFNPEVVPNQLGDPATQGLCVDRTEPSNDSGDTTQEGFELAFQYNLGSFEDSLGWASGFGVLANYTKQEFSGGEILDETSGRGENVLGLSAVARGLLDFSEDAYNFTLYYEKYGLSARARYTWRDDFRTLDFAGGAGLGSTFSLPVVQEARGQLNLSVSYDVSEQLNLGLEVINATESDIVQRCGSDAGPVCSVGYPDRRVTAGISYKF